MAYSQNTRIAFSAISDGSIEALDWYPPEEESGIRKTLEEAVDLHRGRSKLAKWGLQCGCCKYFLDMETGLIVLNGQKYRRRLFRCASKGGWKGTGYASGCQNNRRAVSCEFICREHPHYFPDTSGPINPEDTNPDEDSLDNETIRASSPTYTPASSTIGSDDSTLFSVVTETSVRTNELEEGSTFSSPEEEQLLITIESMKKVIQDNASMRRLIDEQKEEIQSLREEKADAEKKIEGIMAALDENVDGDAFECETIKASSPSYTLAPSSIDPDEETSASFPDLNHKVNATSTTIETENNELIGHFNALKQAVDTVCQQRATIQAQKTEIDSLKADKKALEEKLENIVAALVRGSLPSYTPAPSVIDPEEHTNSFSSVVYTSGMIPTGGSKAISDDLEAHLKAFRQAADGMHVQKKLIDGLKDENDALRTKNEALENRIAAIMAALGLSAETV
ncbi:hypothetical protein BJ508DRAFT_332670 [Ascobolus immersus RN42]|uniref:Uncharacterized protein n=1 Tax=Ascobolus immersus RN42 TaxID=1160509 RepID=A0A3N4HQP7_ASCIM|nr:hypothetical protein BJ508DRAFT_332670 [Ascobolus immersus RN42]